MSLLYPLALGLLLLSLPILRAYRRPPPPLPLVVGSLLLLRGLATRVGRPPPARIRDLLSLLLVLLGLVVMVGAITLRPGPPPGPTILLLDTSASMGAGERWARAEAAVAAQLEGRPEDPLTLITTAPARILAQGSTDRRALERLIEELHPDGEDGDTRSLLLALCAAEPAPRLLFVSDSPLPSSTLVGLGCAIERSDLGPAEPNAGITSLVGRPADQLGSVELQVGLFSTAPGEEQVRVLAGDQVLAEETVQIDGHRELLYALRSPLPSLRVELGARDDLTADNTATLELAATAPVGVLLVTGRPSGYLATALSTHPRVRLDILRPGAPLPASRPDLLVLEALPEGEIPPLQRIAVFGLDPAAIGLSGASSTGQTAIIEVAEEDALLRFVDLEGLHIGRGWVIDPPRGIHPLLSTRSGALALRLPDGRGVWWGIDLAASDLGLRAGFVHLVANLIEEAAPTPAAARGEGLLSRTQTSAQPPEGGVDPASPLPFGRPLVAGGLLALLLEGMLITYRRPRA